MKALTIKNPWAYLIAAGFKNIENRTWKTNFRGRIFIHHGKSCEPIEIFEYPLNKIQWSKLKSNEHWDVILSKLKNMKNGETAIIGSVDIIDCVVGSKENGIWAEYSSGDSKPIYNWVLENPILYESPLYNVKGNLSLWNSDFEEEIINNSVFIINPSKVDITHTSKIIKYES